MRGAKENDERTSAFVGAHALSFPHFNPTRARDRRIQALSSTLRHCEHARMRVCSFSEHVLRLRALPIELAIQQLRRRRCFQGNDTRKATSTDSFHDDDGTKRAGNEGAGMCTSCPVLWLILTLSGLGWEREEHERGERDGKSVRAERSNCSASMQHDRHFR